ncbi:MAG TPA: glycosyltransferase [Chloroflexia bacterium]|nr:glycosyltransferase [Chloroflexia bacterium]
MKILMVTIGYPPEQVGGTETHVLGLVEALKAKGNTCHVTYIEPFEDASGPAIEIALRQYLGTPVHVVRVNRAHYMLEFITFDGKLRAALLAAFHKVVGEVQPDVVHVLPLRLDIESYLIESLRHKGQKVVLSYLSSTTGCARGDLVYMGKEVCDGRIIQSRCTACLYHYKGVSEPAARVLSRLPVTFFRAGYSASDKVPQARKLRSFFSIPLLIEATSKAWTRAMKHADTVVAVCGWVHRVLLTNNVPARKVSMSRLGLRIINPQEVKSQPRTGTTCFGYVGRIGREKGISVLIEALELLPKDTPFRFEVCSSTFSARIRSSDQEELVCRLQKIAASDPRLVIRDHIGDSELQSVLAQWDAIVVPSLWLESGPLVVHEAFSVRTPVIGSDRGGIAELVEHGKTGFLVPPNDAKALSEVLQLCAEQPELLRNLRANIGKVRTTEEVADDMLRLYSA